MISKGDIKDIILILLVIGTAVGISAVIEYAFHAYVHSGTNTVEQSSREEIVSNSFCYATLGEDLEPTLMCRWDTPEFIMKLHGYKPTRRV